MELMSCESTTLRIIHTRPNPVMLFSKRVIVNMDIGAILSTRIFQGLAMRINGKRFTLLIETYSKA
jgi:hypothetical protein